MPPKIKSIRCHKIINSRSDWTIETHVELTDGSVGVQAVPDGASKGENEALYLPVEKAVDIVEHPINDLLKDKDPFNQKNIDDLMLEMDGTPNKSHLGGNSILSVSLAISKACAHSLKLDLYRYLNNLYENEFKFNFEHLTKNLSLDVISFPTPVFNVINGGKHAQNDLSFQEFMAIPAIDRPIEEALEMGVYIYDILRDTLESDGFETGVGDEGGFAPEGFTVEKALDYVRRAISEKYTPGKDVFLGMDVAAESFYDNGRYTIKEEGKVLQAADLKAYYGDLLKKFELIYLEDPFYEGDIDAWKLFYPDFADKLMVVGDDLVVTNPRFLRTAIKQNLINAVIVKPNQVGSLSETLEFIQIAQKHKMSIIISHRSGDTAEDTFVADLAIAVGAEFLKSGAPARGERVAKYNRLLEISHSFS